MSEASLNLFPYERVTEARRLLSAALEEFGGGRFQRWHGAPYQFQGKRWGFVRDLDGGEPLEEWQYFLFPKALCLIWAGVLSEPAADKMSFALIGKGIVPHGPDLGPCGLFRVPCAGGVFRLVQIDRKALCPELPEPRHE